MCVWDGTYTPPEEEREALDQVPGWREDLPAAGIPVQRDRGMELVPIPPIACIWSLVRACLTPFTTSGTRHQLIPLSCS